MEPSLTSDALERVMLRLSMVGEEQLAPILAKLLPSLLHSLRPDMDPLARTKLLEVLTHISKRVKERPSVPLPFIPLLELLPVCTPFASNFVAMYLKMAFGRLSAVEQGAAAPRLLLPSLYPPALRPQLLLMGLAALQHAVIPVEPDARKAVWSSMGERPDDVAAVAAFFLDAMLFAKPAAPQPQPSAA